MAKKENVVDAVIVEDVPTVSIEKVIEGAIAKYSKPDKIIKKWEKEYMALKLNDANDTDAYDKVKKALKIVAGKRIEVEKMRKALKDDSLKYGRAVDAEAKRIIALLSPTETHLIEQKNVRDVFLEKEKQRKADEENALLLKQNEEKEAENQRLREQLAKIQTQQNDAADLFGEPTSTNIQTDFGTARLIETTSKEVGNEPISEPDLFKSLLSIFKEIEYPNFTTEKYQNAMSLVKYHVGEINKVMEAHLY